MSKSKRTKEEEIEHLKKKIQKLQDKETLDSSKPSVSFTGSYRDSKLNSGAKQPDNFFSDDEEGIILSPEREPPSPRDPYHAVDDENNISANNSKNEPQPYSNEQAQSSRPVPGCSTPVANNSKSKQRSSTEACSNYDVRNGSNRHEELLKALGDDLALTGENIHPSLAQKWPNILRKGLPPDVKDKLIKAYAAPDNCRLLKAPSLNEEVTSVIEYNAKNRDQILEQNQNHLGMGIAAIAKAITLLLNQGDNYEVNAMKHLNHGCRLLLDLHKIQTDSRKHLFKNDLMRNDAFRNIRYQDLERDETLFGNKLAKMIKKQGIPTNPPNNRPNFDHQRNDPNFGRGGEHSRLRRNIN